MSQWAVEKSLSRLWKKAYLRILCILPSDPQRPNVLYLYIRKVTWFMGWSVEFWKSVFDWGTVVLVSLTVLTGAGALITGKIIGDRQDEKIAELNTQASEAKRDAEKFKLDIASANERAANAERETARLNARLADRTLSDSQLSSLIENLKPFAGQAFQVVPYWGDKESTGIADRITGGLTKAGWVFVKLETYTMLPGGLVGVDVYVHPESDQRIQQAAAALVRTLNEHGIVAELRHKNDPGHPDDKIMLSVGAKK